MLNGWQSGSRAWRCRAHGSNFGPRPVLSTRGGRKAARRGRAGHESLTFSSSGFCTPAGGFHSCIESARAAHRVRSAKAWPSCRRAPRASPAPAPAPRRWRPAAAVRACRAAPRSGSDRIAAAAVVASAASALAFFASAFFFASSFFSVSAIGSTLGGSSFRASAPAASAPAAAAAAGSTPWRS